MEPIRVGTREFREKLSEYLLKSEVPVIITRHGDTVGYYIPAVRNRSGLEGVLLREAVGRLQESLAGVGEVGQSDHWRKR